MRDRIRKVMESQHMSQQAFANFIELSPASLSSIFTGRTKPTITIIEAIKKKIPTISVDWLMFGTGAMYLDESAHPSSTEGQDASNHVGEPMLDFGVDPVTPAMTGVQSATVNYGRNNRSYEQTVELKNIEKKQRSITEIRIFYDDQTWETFVPKK